MQVNKKETLLNNKHIPVVLYVYFIHQIRINPLHTYQSTQYRILPASPLTTCNHPWSFPWIYCCHKIIVYHMFYKKKCHIIWNRQTIIRNSSRTNAFLRRFFCCKLFIFFLNTNFFFHRISYSIIFNVIKFIH